MDTGRVWRSACIADAVVPPSGDFVRALSKPVPVANETGLADADWDRFACARTLMLEMAPSFDVPEIR